MTNLYTAGPKGEKWASFVFVADYNKALPDLAMWQSKLSFDNFDEGSKWAKSWGDVAKVIKQVCDKQNCKVSFLRISCHGNVDGFALGQSVFKVGNYKQWKPLVENISNYFVPGVSFVTIDACKTGQDKELLSLFSKALGGVDVRGYEENQAASATSEENNRGNFVTCKVVICTKTLGI